MMSVILKAHAILLSSGPVEYPSQFGALLIAMGAVRPVSPQKRHSQQGLALLGGLWLSRLRKAGLAEWSRVGRRIGTSAKAQKS